MPAAIEIADLSFSYPSPIPSQPSAPALRGISLTIEAGQFVALMGPVGAGKTTLCLCLNGLIPQVTGGEFSGRVVVHGLDTRESPVAELAQLVGMVFQEAEVQLFNASVEDEIAFGLELRGWPADAIESRIDWALEVVGLQGFRHRSPRALSGGEQKRLAIATVLAVAPPILVLDEPTAGLDPRGREEVMDVIGRLASERNSTVIVATQDAEMVARHADRLLLLNEGRVVLDETPARAFAKLAEQPNRCISIPQMAVVSSLLRKATGRPFEFLTPEEAYQALSALLVAEIMQGC